jgi:hypothetical protein
MRIYLPATLPLLVRLHEDGELLAPVSHAVTAALREWYAQSDLEELEQAAFYDAERSSLRYLAADATAPRRRIVLAADVPDDAVTPVGSDDDDERSTVLVRDPVPLRAVASVHVDDARAVADVTAAIDALAAAGQGDEDAQFVLDSAEGHDLLWYDVTELDDVLAELLDGPGQDQPAGEPE